MSKFNSVGFVLGNGVSRQQVDLDRLRLRGRIYGCNALYRTFTPDALIATDKPIAEEIQNSGYSKNNRFYTRRPISGLGGQKVLHHTFSSGPNAVAVAINDGCSQIFMLGFDMGPLLDNTFNNVYSGTEFYKPSGTTQTFVGNWVKQLIYIMQDSPGVVFYRIFGDTTADIPELNRMKNLCNGTMDDFLIKINTR